MAYHYYRRTAVRACNALLRHVGLEITRPVRTPGGYVEESVYRGLVNEVQGYYSTYIASDYIPDSQRTDLLCRLLGTTISEALFIIDCLRKTAEIEGSVCEFGVAQGATSALIAREIAPSNKLLYLFDSFEGLPAPTEKDILIDDVGMAGSMKAYEGAMAFPADQVRRRLNEIKFPADRIKIVPGFIEKTLLLPTVPTSVSFAYVDLDFYEPIRVALEFLDKRLVKGGYVMIDDYGYFSAGAQTAVDEFFSARRDRYIMKNFPAFVGHFAVLQKLS